MFTNAYEGVKKIYKAEILALIGAVLSLIAAVLATFGKKAEEVAEGAAPGDGLYVAAGFIVIIAAVIMIIAAILNIIGVNRASKDEGAFKNALYALLAGIAANILVSVFKDNQAVNGIGTGISRAAEILASYYICTGIINLANRIGDSAMSARGKKVLNLLMTMWVVSAVLSILSSLLGTNETMQIIIGILAILSAIASIVAYFLYIGLLGRAKDMLAK